MIHQRERLTLGFEAPNHLARVHACLDQLERHAAADGLRSFGQLDVAHAALAHYPDGFIRSKLSAYTLVTSVFDFCEAAAAPPRHSFRPLHSPSLASVGIVGEKPPGAVSGGIVEPHWEQMSIRVFFQPARTERR